MIITNESAHIDTHEYMKYRDSRALRVTVESLLHGPTVMCLPDFLSLSWSNIPNVFFTALYHTADSPHTRTDEREEAYECMFEPTVRREKSESHLDMEGLSSWPHINRRHKGIST